MLSVCVDFAHGFTLGRHRSSTKFSSSDGRTRRMKEDGQSLGGSLCNHFDPLASGFLVQCILICLESSLGQRVSFFLMVGLPSAHLVSSLSFIEWSWSCSPPISPCPLHPSTCLLTLIIRPTPSTSSHSITNAAQKGFQEIHRRRGRPSAP